jgi:hypothetical protein
LLLQALSGEGEIKQMLRFTDVTAKEQIRAMAQHALKGKGNSK